MSDSHPPELHSAAADLYREAIKVVAWLERLAVRAEKAAENKQFVTLAEAHAADAKNFRASARGLKAAITKAEGK